MPVKPSGDMPRYMPGTPFGTEHPGNAEKFIKPNIGHGLSSITKSKEEGGKGLKGLSAQGEKIKQVIRNALDKLIASGHRLQARLSGKGSYNNEKVYNALIKQTDEFTAVLLDFETFEKKQKEKGVESGLGTAITDSMSNELDVLTKARAKLAEKGLSRHELALVDQAIHRAGTLVDAFKKTQSNADVYRAPIKTPLPEETVEDKAFLSGLARDDIASTKKKEGYGKLRKGEIPENNPVQTEKTKKKTALNRGEYETLRSNIERYSRIKTASKKRTEKDEYVQQESQIGTERKQSREISERAEQTLHNQKKEIVNQLYEFAKVVATDERVTELADKLEGHNPTREETGVRSAYLIIAKFMMDENLGSKSIEEIIKQKEAVLRAVDVITGALPIESGVGGFGMEAISIERPVLIDQKDVAKLEKALAQLVMAKNALIEEIGEIPKRT